MFGGLSCLRTSNWLRFLTLLHRFFVLRLQFKSSKKWWTTRNYSFQGVLKQHEALVNGTKNTSFNQNKNKISFSLFCLICLKQSGGWKMSMNLSFLSFKPWWSSLVQFILTRFLLLTLPVSYCFPFPALGRLSVSSLCGLSHDSWLLHKRLHLLFSPFV